MTWHFTSYVIRKVQIKPTRYYYTCLCVAKAWSPGTPRADQAAEPQGVTLVAGSSVGGLRHVRDMFGRVLLAPSSNRLLLHLPKGVESVCLYKNLYMDVCGSFIHCCQNMEATKLSFSRWWINKLVHADYGILLSNKKKWTLKPWRDMEET